MGLETRSLPPALLLWRPWVLAFLIFLSSLVLHSYKVLPCKKSALYSPLLTVYSITKTWSIYNCQSQTNAFFFNIYCRLLDFNSLFYLLYNSKRNVCMRIEWFLPIMLREITTRSFACIGISREQAASCWLGWNDKNWPLFVK